MGTRRSRTPRPRKDRRDHRHGRGRLALLAALAAWALALLALQPGPAAGVGVTGAAGSGPGLHGGPAGRAEPAARGPRPAAPGSDVPPAADRIVRRPSRPPGQVPGVATTTVPGSPGAARPPAPGGGSAPGPDPGPGSSAGPGPAPTGLLPPANPSADLPPTPDFLTVCSGRVYDDSDACVEAALSAIDNGRSHEGLGPMVLPADWAALSPAAQLFVATNLERTVRGLPPMRAMASALDAAALAGAESGGDPTPPAGFVATRWASNWAGALGNPLEAVYLWMYDDGYGSSNVDCTSPGASGCWGHRDNVLTPFLCQDCVMGAALAPQGWQGCPAWAEILVDTTGDPALDPARRD